jgi:hypothetical protein
MSPFDLPVDEFPACPLTLLAGTRLRGAEIDQLSGEPEHLTLTKAQGQDEDEGGAARSTCRPGLI